MKSSIVLCLLCILGCQRIHPSFYDVVKDHKVLLHETNDAVIASIQAELNESRGRLTAEQIQSIENLIARLEFLKKQGDVIEAYLESNLVDEQLISELLKLKWRGTE